jgi:hypothetical protein
MLPGSYQMSGRPALNITLKEAFDTVSELILRLSSGIRGRFSVKSRKFKPSGICSHFEDLGSGDLGFGEL